MQKKKKYNIVMLFFPSWHVGGVSTHWFKYINLIKLLQTLVLSCQVKDHNLNFNLVSIGVYVYVAYKLKLNISIIFSLNLKVPTLLMNELVFGGNICLGIWYL
jgi:hypothetical protein